MSASANDDAVNAPRRDRIPSPLRSLNIQDLLDKFPRRTKLLSDDSGPRPDHDGIVDVRLERDGILVVTLSRPHKKNSLTRAMTLEFDALMWHLRNLEDVYAVRAIVVTGDARGHAFSSGGDLDFLLARATDTPLHNSTLMRQFYASMMEILNVPVPAFAAVNGIAVGAGVGVALACDFRVAARDTVLSFRFPAMHPGMGVDYLLQAHVNAAAAKRILFFEKELTGARANAIGLLTQMVNHEDEVLPATIELARKLVRENAPAAMRTTVRTMRKSILLGLGEVLGRDANAQALCISQKEYEEVIMAKKKRRKQPPTPPQPPHDSSPQTSTTQPE